VTWYTKDLHVLLRGWHSECDWLVVLLDPVVFMPQYIVI
jgi:hypothetical protein